MSNPIADILKAMVENTTIVITSDLPSLLQHEEVYQLRRVHKDQILQNLPEALQALYEAVAPVMGEDEEITRVDRKTDNAVPKEARNELRAEQRKALRALFGVEDVGGLEKPKGGSK